MIKVYTLLYSHRHGTDVSVYNSKESATFAAYRLASERTEEWEDAEGKARFDAEKDYEDALTIWDEVEMDRANFESLEISETELDDSSSVLTVTHGTPEWDSLFEALDQYTDNQQDYLANHCEPGEEKRGAKHLKFARTILDKMNAFYASLAEGPS